MHIITPTAAFPDPAVAEAAEAIGLTARTEIQDETGTLYEQDFRDPEGATRLRYLHEPDLDIPVIAIEGPQADAVRAALGDAVAHVSGLAAAMAYDAGADEQVRMTLLRIIAAHSLQRLHPAMLRAAELAARDGSAFVRLGVVLLAHYARAPQVTDLVRGLVCDPDPDVRDFAAEVLRTLAETAGDA
ncbi:hypothetical protein SAMN05878503_105159 [Cereibacter ovatus]|uniref:HEAT repeat domain-containing protein n=1 Tax=Cereibacter ovatus TaxID=439529 RepID=A0A285CRN9_9RHOB|nr:hypothetical protein [Cereibacter ovatus]SNX70250.1 hypothetical protein SAMN05878503_105159 [Cereibacter ovatus]